MALTDQLLVDFSPSNKENHVIFIRLFIGESASSEQADEESKEQIVEEWVRQTTEQYNNQTEEEQNIMTTTSKIDEIDKNLELEKFAQDVAETVVTNMEKHGTFPGAISNQVTTVFVFFPFLTHKRIIRIQAT